MTSILRRPPIRHILTRSYAPKTPHRAYTPAPTSTSGPILTRRADRALPPLSSIENPFRIWRHLPLVAIVMVVGGAAIFNYEKLNHSVVSSSLYALRVHPTAQEVLGGEIYFANRIPWIRGSIDPMHGVIDVSFGVKGTKDRGKMRFRATSRRKGEFVGQVRARFGRMC